MRKTWNKNKFEIDFIVEPKLDLGINVRYFFIIQFFVIIGEHIYICATCSSRVLMFEMEF